MTCEFAYCDGAYVLGSLDLTERVHYERHLAGCVECSDGVSAIAGLPGLLALVPREVLEPPGEQAPVRETLLPAVFSELRRTRNLRAMRTVGVAAAAAIVLIAGTAAVVTLSDGDDARTDTPPASVITPAPSQLMERLGSGRVTGWVSLTEVGWGTRIDLSCACGTGRDGGWRSYALVVRTADGHIEQAGTWRSTPGRETHITMTTTAAPDDIVAVEVRTTDGAGVLRLTPAQ